MTDIETLLSVDGGRIPRGVAAFFMRDPELDHWRRLIAGSVLFCGAAMVSAFCRADLVWTLLLAGHAVAVAILATLAALRATPARAKRRVVVVTSKAIVMRDGNGLRTWDFEELADAHAWRYADRVDLLLLGRDGRQTFIDCRAFDAGEHLPDAIAQYLPAPLSAALRA